MADRAQGAVSFTPIVTIAADADADAVDEIHHNIKGDLGGDLTFTVQDVDDNWFYAPNVICTDTDTVLFAHNDSFTDLVGASGDQINGPNEPVGRALTFTDGSNVNAAIDKVWFLFVKNTGTSDNKGTTTTNSVYLCFDGQTAAYDNLDNIEIKAGEAWMGNLAGPIVRYIRIITGQTRGTGTAATVNGSTNVRCINAAIIEDTVS